MAINWRCFWRKTHRRCAVLAALPLLVVFSTGVVLQLKKESAWIQPATQRGSAKSPSITWDAMLAAVRSRPEAAVRTWDDVSRVDVQPDRGIAKVQCRNRWEVQVDLATGQVLQTAYRRSDLIESLHDGSWFHEHAKLWVFLPTGLVALALWFTGIYLFVLPIAVRWRRRRSSAGVR